MTELKKYLVKGDLFGPLFEVCFSFNRILGGLQKWVNITMCKDIPFHLAFSLPKVAELQVSGAFDMHMHWLHVHGKEIWSVQEKST